METQFYYIHGLGGSSQSSKFLELQKQYPNIKCFEWKPDSNMKSLLQQWKEIIDAERGDICVIANSTGCNWGFQLKQRTKRYINLVMINPLLRISDVCNPEIIPENLKQYLIDIEKTSGVLFLIGSKDDVVNNNSLPDYILSHNKVIYDVTATHEFENLDKYYSTIDQYVDSIYL